MRTRLPLPPGWKRRVRSSIVHVLFGQDFQLLEQRTFARHTWTSTVRLNIYGHAAMSCGMQAPIPMAGVRWTPLLSVP